MTDPSATPPSGQGEPAGRRAPKSPGPGPKKEPAQTAPAKKAPPKIAPPRTHPAATRSDAAPAATSHAAQPNPAVDTQIRPEAPSPDADSVAKADAVRAAFVQLRAAADRAGRPSPSRSVSLAIAAAGVAGVVAAVTRFRTVRSRKRPARWRRPGR